MLYLWVMAFVSFSDEKDCMGILNSKQKLESIFDLSSITSVQTLQTWCKNKKVTCPGLRPYQYF